MSSEFLKDLIDHKQKVAGYMQLIANDLFRRAAVHDNSKFEPEEFEPYSEAFPELQQYAYGTDEFKAVLKKIQPAIQHHYRNNDHHPEFEPNGISDMSLVQLIEMLCDWLAASERSQTDFGTGLEKNKERFFIGNQLFSVLKNTVEDYAPHRLKTEPDSNTLYPDVLLSGEK